MRAFESESRNWGGKILFIEKPLERNRCGPLAAVGPDSTVGLATVGAARALEAPPSPYKVIEIFLLFSAHSVSNAPPPAK